MDSVKNSVGGFGIGVSDLEKSEKFYAEVFGMRKVRTWHLPEMDEFVMAHEDRTRPLIILMHYTDGSKRKYKNNPIKLVFYVADAYTIIERIRSRGLEITREPSIVPDVQNSPVVGMAKDPDGYVIEVLQVR